MPLAGRAYLAFAAIVLVTMATRVGWINWHLILTMTATLVVGGLIILILVAVFFALPAAVFIIVADRILGPDPACPKIEGHRDVQ